MDVLQRLISALKSICALFKANNIQYCLAGGLAVSMIARPRATEDVDLIVLMDEANKDVIETLLKETFDIIQSNPTMHFRNASIWRIVVSDGTGRESGFILIDLIFADRIEYRKAVLDSLRIEIDGVEIAVISPNDLIEVKKLAGRPVDILDIESIREAMQSKE